MSFLKPHASQAPAGDLRSRDAAPPSPPSTLGPLEIGVMEVVWLRGSCNVRDVVEQLERPLAYTTIMTTLDRLYKKGLLERRKSERAFVYAPRFSRSQWERRRAGEFVASFLAGPRPAREVLLSCLLEAVHDYDAALLDSLSKKIKAKRRDLDQSLKQKDPQRPDLS